MQKLVYCEIKKPNKNTSIVCDVKHFQNVRKETKKMVDVIHGLSIWMVAICVFILFLFVINS